MSVLSQKLAGRIAHEDVSFRTKMLEIAAGLDDVIAMGRGDPDFHTPAHIVAAAQLSWRDLRARPVKYTGRQRLEATVTTRYMRWGGIALGLFIVWHLLNLSTGVAISGYDQPRPYANIVENFFLYNFVIHEGADRLDNALQLEDEGYLPSTEAAA